MPFPVAAAIAGGASLLGGWFNSNGQNSADEKSRQYALDMYERQKNDNMAMWRMQNDYNDPAAQMERLRKAGLNPNLVYGNGSAVNVSSPIKGGDPQSWQKKNPEWGNMMQNGIGSYQNFAQQEAQTNNLKAQNTLIANQALNVAASTDKIRQGMGFDSDLFPLQKESLMGDISYTKSRWRNEEQKWQYGKQGYENSALESSLRQQLMKSQNIEVQTRIKNLLARTETEELNNNLRRMGINPGDPQWQRIIGQLVFGNDTVKSMLKKIKQL